jgi:hypothetical protein
MDKLKTSTLATFSPNKRATFGKLLGITAASLLTHFANVAHSASADRPKSVRVGYQKGTPILLLSRQHQALPRSPKPCLMSNNSLPMCFSSTI